MLDVELGEEETRVRASLTMKQNPDGRRETRLVLDGSIDLATQSIAIDGRELSHNEYAIEDGKLTLFDLPEQFVLKPTSRLSLKTTNRCLGCINQATCFALNARQKGFAISPVFGPSRCVV